MKKIILIPILCLINSIAINAQQIKGIIGDTNWMGNWTNFKPTTAEYPETTNILTGIIDSDLTLYKKNTYRLIGIVYITNNAVLTIEPGTVIRGDVETCGTLVISKGSKIMAEGDQTDPIVFTSNREIYARKPGDWGGIIIMGEAPINKIGGVGFLDFNLDPMAKHYGGQNQDSNSGILKYVRIEFSGRKLNALKELNGLSLAGVGRKTKFNFIQISYSNDDSYECYGGDVNFDNIISFRATDDDFDFTQGAQCNISNSLAIRYPFSSDVSGSRCFEIDSFDKIENADVTKKLTKITATNITLANLEENNQGLVREAIYIKDKSYFSLNNSVVSGFKNCILLDGNIANISANLAKINLQTVLINNCDGGIQSEIPTNDPEIKNWYSNESFSIEYSKTSHSALFKEPSPKKTFDFRLKVDPIVVSGN
ncbi:hypothetical protein BC952_2404 [Flavobacterium limicola]|uniref:Uncharacterized protein n=1 Tax=Flavobacterium limicola TaxID=180441 RepID=A0A495RY61_9FLAO|nr:hypothetical protein [Flavobacterium limicola]RKS92502.1 hypothetical protein BC952_2404 [Flavobacterium limicola]